MFLSHIFSSYLDIEKTKLVVFTETVIPYYFLHRMEIPRPLQSADAEVMPQIDQSRSTSRHIFTASCFYHYDACMFLKDNEPRIYVQLQQYINAVAFNSIFTQKGSVLYILTKILPESCC